MTTHFRIPGKLHKTDLCKAIQENNVSDVRRILSSGKKMLNDFRRISVNGETYLHIAVKQKADVAIIKELIPKVRIGQKNEEKRTALELAIESNGENLSHILKCHNEYILECIKNGNYPIILELAMDGWASWPMKGIPEIEDFSEAPGYLTPTGRNFGINKCMPNILKKVHVQQLASVSIKQDANELRKQVDIIGMNLLHKAILYKDIDTATSLLKFEDMCLAQDNMGRTPIHYAATFGEDSEIWEKVTSLENHKSLLSTIDNVGNTPVQYKDGNAKIDLHKLRDFCKGMSKYITQDRLIRVLFGDDEGYFGSEFDNFGDSKPDELLEVMMNCLGKPLIDASGRNFLHKAIILNSDQEDFVIKLLKIDKEHLLYKGQDLWGRTALHYAAMFNKKYLLSVLCKNEGHGQFLPSDVVKQVKQIKDVDGKTYEDYIDNTDDEDYKENRANNPDQLGKTIHLLANLPKLKQAQHTIAQLLLNPREVEALPAQDQECVWENVKDFIETVFDSEQDKLIKMVMSMQMPTGVPLGYYLLLKQSHTVEDISWNSREFTDHLGRSPYHYICYVPEDSFIREGFFEMDPDDPDDSSDQSNFESSDSDSLNSDGTDDDENKDGKIKVDNGAISVKKYIKLTPLRRVDVKLKTPVDYYKGKKEPFGSIQLILDELRNCINNQTLAKLVKTGENVKAGDYGNKLQRERSVTQTNMTTNQRYSADKRTTDARAGISCNNSPPFDTEYLKKALGETLTGGLSVISLVQPADPIEFLAHYLYKHAEHMAHQKEKQSQETQLQLEIQEAELEKRRKERMQSEAKLIRDNNNELTTKLQHEHADNVILEADESDTDVSFGSDEDSDNEAGEIKKKKKRKPRFERQLSGMSFAF